MKRALLLIMTSSLIAGFILAFSGCRTEPTPSPTPPVVEFTEESSLAIAEEFVRNSPTFLFDGMEETLELVETRYPELEHSWVFVYQFDSRQAGYGDRTGEMLAEVITPHEAVITVSKNEVVTAVMDETWDMLGQELIEG